MYDHFKEVNDSMKQETIFMGIILTLGVLTLLFSIIRDYNTRDKFLSNLIPTIVLDCGNKTYTTNAHSYDRSSRGVLSLYTYTKDSMHPIVDNSFGGNCTVVSFSY